MKLYHKQGADLMDRIDERDNAKSFWGYRVYYVNQQCYNNNNNKATVNNSSLKFFHMHIDIIHNTYIRNMLPIKGLKSQNSHY